MTGLWAEPSQAYYQCKNNAGIPEKGRSWNAIVSILGRRNSNRHCDQFYNSLTYMHSIAESRHAQLAGFQYLRFNLNLISILLFTLHPVCQNVQNVQIFS